MCQVNTVTTQMVIILRMLRHTLVNGLRVSGTYAPSGCSMDNLVQQVMGPH